MARHPHLVISIILCSCLGPFLNKAIHTDDALFVWSGQWIQKHPADFYGAEVNWWVSAMPMWVANWNPTLQSYMLPPWQYRCYGITTLPFGSVGWLGHVSLHPAAWLNLTGPTTNGAAGFYGANWGPIPFATGGMPGQTYFVVKVFSHVQMDSVPVNQTGTHIVDVPSIPKIACVVKDPLEFPNLPEAAAQIKAAGQSEADGKVREAIQHYREALKVDANNPEALNKLAWILATTSHLSLRNGAEAVGLATRALKVTDSCLPAVYGTLGAAYAETGQFSRAAEMTKISISLAHLTGQEDVADQEAGLLRLYLAGRTMVVPGR